MNNSQQDQPLIAALYARVSTARQEEQETIESQIEEIKKRILDDGNILPTENVFQDDGWTGEMLQRPGLDAMRDASVANSFQVLYVYDRGRLSRMFAYQEIILEEIINREIQLFLALLAEPYSHERIKLLLMVDLVDYCSFLFDSFSKKTASLVLLILQLLPNFIAGNFPDLAIR
jgi:DNA invertase Pin-like site-specific DNA recombinase